VSQVQISHAHTMAWSISPLYMV